MINVISDKTTIQREEGENILEFGLIKIYALCNKFGANHKSMKAFPD
jgi:hypothetical protein